MRENACNYIHEMFRAVAQRDAEKVAIVCGEKEVSYGVLEQESNRLATYLLRQGSQPGARMVITDGDAGEVILAMLACLKAGVIFVPVDVQTPLARLAHIIAQTEPAWLWTQEDQLAVVQGALTSCGSQAQVLGRMKDSTQDPHDGWNTAHSDLEESTQPRRAGEEATYIYYTSGTTGQPKGIVGQLKSIDHFIRWEQRTLGVQGDVRVSQLTSPGFDAFLRDVFVPLCSGGTVCMPERREVVHSGRGLLRYVREQGVEILHLVPSLWRRMLEVEEVEEREPLEQLRYVVLAGEMVQTRDVRRWYERYGTQVQLINLYGPSETTMTKFCYFIQPTDVERRSIPVGKPIDGARYLILDKQQEICPEGKVGEIYIRTPYRTLGYYGRPDLTQEVFVANPFSSDPSDLIYKTGDLGRLLPDGTLELLGRKDHQVKIRGIRVELGEIEGCLRELEGVSDAVVIDAQDSSEERSLFAYVVLHAGVEPEQVRASLAQRLPAALVPSVIMPLAVLPRTLSGKVDRKALPAPSRGGLGLARDYVAPGSLVEELLVQVWKQVLRLEQVGVRDHFFALGGHSLLATQMIGRVRTVLGVEVPLRALFEEPTIEGLARVVQAARQQGQESSVPRVQARARGARSPLSFAQQRLWFLEQLEPGNVAYLIVGVRRLRGKLEVQGVQESLKRLEQRHESLRTTFEPCEGEPMQVVGPARGRVWPVLDLSGLATPQREEEARRLVGEEGRVPCDVEAGPLWRVRLVRLQEQEHVLVLTQHHLITDGWSSQRLYGELSHLYQGWVEGKEVELEPLAVQYADYALWQRDWLVGEVREQQMEYWRKQLEGAAQLEMPQEKRRPGRQSFRGAVQRSRVGKEQREALEHLSQREGVTMFMTLLAAFAVLLGRWSGQQDISIGTPIANRRFPELEPLIGFFVNMLVLRNHVAEDLTFQQLLSQVRETALGAYMHQDIPFEQLVEELRPERDLSRSPLCQVVFNYQQFTEESTEIDGLTIGGLVQYPQAGQRDDPRQTGSPHSLEYVEMPKRLYGSALGIEQTTTKFDLSMTVMAGNDELHYWLEYSTDLFETETIDRLLKSWMHLLEAIVVAPHTRIAELPVMSAEERRNLVVDWNATNSDYPAQMCLHTFVEMQAISSPDAIAVVAENACISYGFLDQAADRVATYLQRLRVEMGVSTGLYMERSLAGVISLVAIFKAGGSYVPLDITAPTERLAWMLEETQAAVLITHSSLHASLPQTSAYILCLDQQWDAIQSEAPALATRPLPAETIAYIMYTSGSTGRPKGVMISHCAIVNRLWWGISNAALQAGDRVVQLASWGFDISLWELFGPWMVGAATVIVSSQEVRDSQMLIRRIHAERISVLHAVPSLLNVLLQEAAFTECKDIRCVQCGGEAVGVELVRRVFTTLAVPVYQFYGPTEASISVTGWMGIPAECPQASVSLGRPIANTQIYIVDAYGQPAAVGVYGEIWIGGIGLSWGYVLRPDLTAERFTPNPFSENPGTRVYRTGDIGRFRANGDIEFIRRKDTQVKLRGYRVEPGEIEALLEGYPIVQQALVLMRVRQDQEVALVAYLVLQALPRQTYVEHELLAYLRQYLPSYMLPSQIVLLDAFPLTANGKVDKHALLTLEQRDEEREVVAARNELEELLLSLWCEVLARDQISIYDNFFAMGGHSLLATKLISRIRVALSMDVPLRYLFEAPTVASFAETLAEEQEGDEFVEMLTQLENLSEAEVQAMLISDHL